MQRTAKAAFFLEWVLLCVCFDLRSVVQLEYTFVGGLYGVESSHPATAL
jgi:hypothetical protein